MISDDGLRCVGHMTALTHLQLIGVKIGDEGIVHLKPLSNLQSLALRSTLVSDSAIDEVVQIRSLRYLGVDETAITREGADRLSAVMPNCRVGWSAPAVAVPPPSTSASEKSD